MNEIKIETTNYHRLMQILSFSILIGTFIFLAVYWNNIPDKVPAHYNAFGEINRFGKKSELLFCPIIALTIYLGISILERYPKAWNTGVNITPENRNFVYTQLKNMIITEKFAVVFTFSFITAMSALSLPLPSWFLPMDLLIVFLPIIYYGIKSFKKHNLN